MAVVTHRLRGHRPLVLLGAQPIQVNSTITIIRTSRRLLVLLLPEGIKALEAPLLAASPAPLVLRPAARIRAQLVRPLADIKARLVRLLVVTKARLAHRRCLPGLVLVDLRACRRVQAQARNMHLPVSNASCISEVRF